MSPKENSNRVSIFLLFFILASFSLVSSSVSENLELNTILMESTFKIQGPSSVGPVTCTIFVVGLPSKKDTTKAYYVMVTAGHVLEAIKGDSAQLFLRKKKEKGTYEKILYSVSIRKKGNPLWVRHPDKDVDVAVMYLPLPSIISIPLLSTDFLANDSLFQEFELHPGDQLLCLGYPLGFEGPFGFPILRSGKIASYPLLPSKAVKGFFFDFHVFPGNSGGPVYFVESNRAFKGGIHVGTFQFIAGLVSEEVRVPETYIGLYDIEQKTHPLGLAKVVPASFIKETIALLPPMK